MANVYVVKDRMPALFRSTHHLVYDINAKYNYSTSSCSRMTGFQNNYVLMILILIQYASYMICCYDLFVAWFSSYDFEVGQCLQAHFTSCAWWFQHVSTPSLRKRGAFCAEPSSWALSISAATIGDGSSKTTSMISSPGNTMSFQSFLVKNASKYGAWDPRWLPKTAVPCHIIPIKVAKPRYRAVGSW